ncbi:hypothetical protein EV702DRAFT_1097912, partial [Suillus placidus]
MSIWILCCIHFSPYLQCLFSALVLLGNLRVEPILSSPIYSDSLYYHDGQASFRLGQTGQASLIPPYYHANCRINASSLPRHCLTCHVKPHSACHSIRPDVILHLATSSSGAKQPSAFLSVPLKN